MVNAGERESESEIPKVRAALGAVAKMSMGAFNRQCRFGIHKMRKTETVCQVLRKYMACSRRPRNSARQPMQQALRRRYIHIFMRKVFRSVGNRRLKYAVVGARLGGHRSEFGWCFAGGGWVRETVALESFVVRCMDCLANYSHKKTSETASIYAHYTTAK